MRKKIKEILRNGLCRYYRLLSIFGFNYSAKPPVNFVVEKANWAIRWVGMYICDNISKKHSDFARITTNPASVINRIIHFGSQYQWLLWEPYIATDNKIVVSFFHGKPDDGILVKEHIEKFLLSTPKISKIVTGAELIRNRLIKWGVEPNKIIKIPIGCDTNFFVPPVNNQKQNARIKLGIPNNSICIGSYQKDGVGWGDGMEPKLIKGPDIFFSTVKELSKHIKIFVLLTGPSRGYVKSELKKNNIPYFHSYLTDYREILKFYHALDFYLVTSREEGGPMALMESMATHVPVVSTRVGQAEDLIKNKETGGLVNVDDIDAICERTLYYLNLDEDIKKSQLIKAREKVVNEFDWKFIANEHYSKVYLPLIKEEKK